MTLGIDLVEIAEIARMEEAHGERFLRRVYSPDELTGLDAMSAHRRLEFLAGRWAAKEAVIKALRLGRDDPTPLTDIVITAHRDGWPTVELRGSLAASHRDISLSVSHSTHWAIAVALLQEGTPHG